MRDAFRYVTKSIAHRVRSYMRSISDRPAVDADDPMLRNARGCPPVLPYATNPQERTLCAMPFAT